MRNGLNAELHSRRSALLECKGGEPSAYERCSAPSALYGNCVEAVALKPLQQMIGTKLRQHCSFSAMQFCGCEVLR